LTSKIHAVVDTNGLPVRLALTAGEAHDNRLARARTARIQPASAGMGAGGAVRLGFCANGGRMDGSGACRPPLYRAYERASRFISNSYAPMSTLAT
jgi:transposase